FAPLSPTHQSAGASGRSRAQRSTTSRAKLKYNGGPAITGKINTYFHEPPATAGILVAPGRIWILPPSWKAPRSLSLRGTSGERGTFHRIGAANWNPLSRTLSPLLR